MRGVVLLVLLGMTLSLSAAPAPLPKRRGEKLSLDGVWKLTKDRNQRGGSGPESFEMTITGNQMKFRVRDDSLTMEIDADFKAGTGPYPRPIDVRIIQARFQGEIRKEERTSLGLYRLDGDVLTLCMGNNDKKRPTDLTDKSAEVMVFTRVR
jgi:uncharacterized protein (TIGR03067 family)